MALLHFVLAALVALADAGPISYVEPTTQCSRTCPTDADFPYVPGKTYRYAYESTITTHIPGVTEEFSQLHLTATASFEAIDRCEMVLVLSDVALEDANPGAGGRRGAVPRAQGFQNSLQQHPLRFSLVNGRVLDLCPAEAEPTWVLNAKRAVLSGLQKTVPTELDRAITVQETDVVGDCDVTYSPAGTTWSTTKLNKVKDLLACTGRQGTESMIDSVRYHVPSKLQNLPLMKSTHNCELDINSEGRVVTTTCQENHVFRPFSRENSGASTSVEFSLTFSSLDNSVTTSATSIDRRTGLLFEHPTPTVDETAQRRSAVQALRGLCTEAEQGVTTETPQMFLAMVKEMRQLDVTALTGLVQLVQSGRPCARASKFVFDALPTLASPASLTVMRDLMIAGSVTGVEADLWMTSMTFIKDPTKEMLAEVKPLLTQSPPQTQAVLAVSSMVHSYCKSHPNCVSEREVTDIISTLEAMLGRDCSANHDQVILALKALGNAGRIETAVDTLTRCFQNEALPMEIRVFAVGAFRRMQCNVDKEPLMRLLEDVTTDAELRIQAYLMIMQCPDYSTVQHLGRLLQAEEVNQVGSFIWTHLTNLAESSSPLKQDIQRLISSSDLQRAFDLDKRKFSRNVEWSMFSEELNSGAAVESNLVWSPKSFMPRSASLNLTVDLFGQSVNLMEVGGRVEGLDSVLESFFGPESSEASETPANIQRLDQRFRSTDGREPQGSYFMRVFGNEISFADFHGLDLSSVRDRFNYLQWILDLANDREFELTKSMVLLDTEICVPTVAGFPLRLAVDGAVVTDLQVRGHMDLRSASSSPRGLSIVGRVKPSAALQVTGEMGVDAGMASTGLRMRNTLHTSTVADGTIELQDGQVFNMDINMPEESMDIFSAESKFFVMYREEAREQSMLPEGRLEMNECTGPKLESAMGVQLCGQVSVATATADGAPWNPLTGPNRASVTLRKTDTFSKYHLEARLIKEPESGALSNFVAAVSFNTPGSRVDRELTTSFDLNVPQKTLNVNLRSPWKKVDLQTALELTDGVKRATGQLTIDDSSVYRVLGEVPMEQNRYNTQFQPRFEVALPGQEPYILSGTVLYRPNKRTQIDLSLENVYSTPVTIRGEVTRIGKSKQYRYEGDLAVRAPVFKAQIAGSVDRAWSRTDSTTSSSIEVKYKVPNHRQQSLSAHNRIHVQSTPDAKQLSFTGGSASSLWSEYDTDYSVLLSKDTNALEMAISTGFTNDKPKRITVNGRALYDMQAAQKQITASASFEAPFLNAQYTAALNHYQTQHDVTTSLQASGADGQLGRLDVGLHKGQGSRLNMSAEVALTMPGRHIAYYHSLRETRPGEYNNNLTLALDRYTQLELLSVYKMGDQHEFTGSLKAPFIPDIAVEASLVPSVTDMQGSGKVMYGEDQYALSSSWTHRLNGNTLSTAANMELAIPGRKVIWTGQMRKGNDAFTGNAVLKWDADNDSTKKMVCDVNVQLSATEPSVTCSVQWWPNKFVEFTTTIRHDQQSYDSATRDLEGSAAIRSSFAGLEEIRAAFKHERTAGVVKTHGEVSWGSENTISGDYQLTKNDDWSNVDASFDLNTPFEELSHLKLEYNHDLQSNSLSCNGKVQWNEMHVAVETTSSADSWNAIDSAVRITSTFAGYEDMTFGLHHVNRDGHIESNVQALIGTQSYSLTLQMDRSTAGVCSGTITAVLPMLNSPNTLVWQQTNNQYKSATHAELTIQGERSTVDFNMKMRRKTEISAQVSTPYFPAVSALVSHETDRRSLARSLVAEVTYDGQTVKLENQFNYQPGVLLMIEGKFTSPFTGFEEITLSIEDKYERGQYVAHNEFKWASNKKISIDGTFSQNMPEFQGQLEFYSPYTNTISLTGANRLLDGMWQLTGSLVKDEQTLTQGTYTLGMGDLKKLSIDFHSAYPQMEHLFFDIEQSGSLREFSFKMELQHNMLSQPIKLDTQFNYQPATLLSVQSQFNSPFAGFEEITLTMEDKYEGGQYIAHNEIKWANNEKISLDGTLSYDLPTFQGQLELYSPYTNIISLTGANRLVGGMWQLTGSLVKDDQTLARGTFTLGMGDLKKLSIDFHSTCPYMEDLVFDIEQSGSLGEFSCKMELQHNMLRQPVKLQTQFIYQPGMLVSVNSIFTSPIAGFEEITLTIEDKFEHGQYIAHNEFKWASNEKISLGGTLSYNMPTFQGQLEFYSPYTNVISLTGANRAVDGMWQLTGALVNDGEDVTRGTYTLGMGELKKLSIDFHSACPYMEHIFVDIEQSGSLREFSCKMELQHNMLAQPIKLETQFNYQSGLLLSIQSTFTSPFAEFEDITLAIEDKYEGGQYIAHNELKWASNKKISLDGTLSYDLPTYQGHLEFYSPYTNIVSLSGVNRLVGGMWQHTGSLVKDGQTLARGTFTLGMEDLKKIMIDFHSICPYLENLVFDIEHSGSISEFSCKIELQHNMLSRPVKLDTQFNYQPGTLLSVHSAFTSPFAGFEELTLTMEDKYENSQFIAHNEFKWASNKKVSLDGTLTHNMPEFQGQLEFHSPYSNTITLTGANRLDNGMWQLTGSTVKDGQTVSQGTLTAGMGDLKKISLDFHSTHPYMENLVFDFELSGSLREFNGKMELEHSILASKIQVLVAAKTTNLDDIMVQLDLQTPFTGVQVIHLMCSHKLMAYATYQTRLTFEVPQKKIEFSNNLRMPSMNTFTTDTRLSLDNIDQYQLETSLNAETDIVASAMYRGPGGDSKSIRVRHEGQPLNFRTSCDIISSPDQTIAASIQFIKNSQVIQCNVDGNVAVNGVHVSTTNEFKLRGTELHALFKVNVPEESSIEISHNGGLQDFANTLTLKCPVLFEGTISGNSAFRINGNAIEAEAGIQTPFRDYSNIGGRYTHTGDSNNFNCNLNMYVEESRIIVDNRWRLANEQVEFNSQVQTPFSGYNTMGVSLTHSGTPTNFNSEISASIEDNTISATASFKIVGNHVETAVSLNTPFQEVNSITAQLQHDGVLTSFRDEFTATLNDQAITSSASFSVSNNRMHGSLRITTPFTALQSFSLVASQEGSLSDFTNEVIISLNEERMQSAVNFKIAGRKIEGSATLNTPFSQLSAVAVTFSHEGVMSHFNNDISVSVNDNTISSNVAFVWEPTQKNVVVRFRNPYFTPEEVEVNLSHEGSMYNCHNAFILTVNGDQLADITGTFQWTNTRLHGSLDAHVPGYSLEIASTNQGHLSDFTNELSLGLNGDVITLTHAFRKQGSTIQGSLNIERGNDFSLVFSFRHNGPLNNMEDEFSAALNGQAITYHSIFRITDGIIEASANIATPFQVMEDLSVNLRSEGPLSNIKNELALSLNQHTVSIAQEFQLLSSGIQGGLGINYQDSEVFVISLRHNGVLNNMESELSAILNGQAITCQTTFTNTGDIIQISANIATPFPLVETLSVNFKSEGPMSNMKNDLAVSLNQQPISITQEFKWISPIIQGGVVISYKDSEVFSISFTHNGLLNNMEDELSVVFNGQAVTYQSTFIKTEDITQISANVATPFPMVETLSLNFKSEGPLSSIKNELAVSLNQQPISIAQEFKWLAPGAQGQVSINYQDSDIFAIGFKHEGPWNAFTNEMFVTVFQQRVSINNAFTLNGDQLDATAAITTPFSICEVIAVNLVHRGGLTDFNNQLSVSMNQQTIQAVTQFRIQGSDMTASWELTTPFTIMPSAAVVASRSGPWYDCSNSLTVTINEQSVEFGFVFKLTDSHVEGVLTVNQLRATLYHDLVGNSMNNDFSISFGGEEARVVSAVQIDQSGINSRVQLTTPFNGFRTVAMSANTQNADYVFRLQKDMDEFSLTTSHSQTPQGGRVTFTITTPFSSARQITGSFSHDGPISDFQHAGSLGIGGQQVEYSLAVAKTTTGAEGTFEIRTPFTSFEHFKVHGTVSGELSNFNHNGYIILNDHQWSGRTEFRATNEGIHVYMGIETPTEYSITIDHTGNWQEFNNQISIKNGPRPSAITVATHFRKSATAIEVTSVINSPAWNNVRFTFNQEGGIANFRQIVSLEYNQQTLSNTVEFSMDGSQVSGKLSVVTPQNPYITTINAEFSHQGGWNNFQNTAKLEVNGNEYEASSQYRELSVKTVGGITLKLPTEYACNFMLKGEPSDFKNVITLIIDGQESQVSVDYKNKGNVFETALTVRTPYQGYENFAAEFNYKNKRVLRISASIQTPFEGFESMTFEMSRRGTWNQFTVDGRLVTSFSVLPELTFEINHRGQLNDFETSGNMVVAGRRFAGTIMLQSSNGKIETSASIQSPYFSSLGYTFSHEGSLQDFTSAGSVHLDDNAIEGSLSFRSQPGIELISTLRTSFSGLQVLSVNFNHQGSPLAFTSTGSVTVNQQTMSGNVAFRKDGELVENSVELQIPNMQPVSYSVQYNGNPRKFQTTITIATPWEIHRTFGLQVDYEGVSTNFRSTITLTTPYSSLPRIVATLNHNGALADFTTSMSMEYGNNRVTGEAMFKKTGGQSETAVECSLHLTSTYALLQDLQITTQHQQASGALNGQVAVAYNSHQYLDMNYRLDVASGSSKSATVNMRAPRAMSASITWQSDARSTTGDMSATYENRPYSAHFELRDRELTAQANLPSRLVTMTTRYDLSSERIAHFLEIQWSESTTDKLSWDLEATRSSRGQQIVYDGRLVLNAKQYSLTSTFSHRVNAGRHYVTEVNVQGLVLRTDLQLRQPNLREFTAIITLQHPSFTRDVVCTLEGIIEPETPRFDLRLNLVYADQEFEISGKIADESQSSSQTRYIAEAHVTHPASALDVQFSSQLTNNEETMGGDMQLTYMMTRDRQLKNAALRAEINKLREEINMEIQSLEKHMSVTGRRTIADAETGHQHFSVSGSMDETNLHAELDMDQSQPSFDLSVTLDPERELHVYGRYMDASSIMLEAYHQTSGTRVQDVQLSLRLADANILNARAYVRPQLISDIQTLLSTESELGATLNQVSAVVSEEYSQKAAQIVRATEPLVSSWEQLETYATSTYDQMYRQNDFYLRDIAAVVQPYFQELCTMVRERLEDLRAQYSAHFARKMQEVEQIVRDLKIMAREAFAIVIEKIQESRDTVNGAYNQAAQSVHDTTLEWIDSVRSHPMVSSAIDSVMSMEPADYFIPLRESYNNRVQRIYSAWEDIMGQPGLQSIKTWVEDLVQAVVNHVEFDATVQRWIDEARQVGMEALATRALNWVKAQLDNIKFEVITWEPSQGEAEVRVTLPFRLEDLSTLPHYDLMRQLEAAGDFVEQHLPIIRGTDYSIWDTVYAYKPSSDPSQWIPPFSAHATLAGNQHYMTFDKTFYDFQGECSYLLARDFIDGRFTVEVHYDQQGKQSLSVDSANQHIEIRPDFRVIVGGSQTDLPYKAGLTTVRRIGNSIRVDNDHGLTVLCDLAYDRCSVNVSGWYYGKTGGLLGTYDNEPSTDFLTVDRVPAASVADFAATWSVGRSCGTANNAAVTPPALDDDRYAMCAQYFEDNSSPFRPCFGQVSKSVFMTMCLTDVTTKANPEAALCNMAAFYVDECQRAGVNIEMPSDCVSCALSDGRTLNEGDRVTLEGAAVPQSADVVFVVSHKECNQEVVSRLNELVRQVERQFQAAGMSDVKYGLVGYGNEGLLAAPHSHTFNGQLMGSKDELASHLEHFETMPGQPEDSFAAIQFAASYPFRAGVSKAIVLVPCDSCHEESASSAQVRHALDSAGISLHVLMQHDFRLRTRTPKTSFIFGVDSEGLFTPKHVGDAELIGDADLRHQVALPSDLCAALTDSTQGSTFNIGQLLHTRPAMQKRFLDVLSRLIVKKAGPATCTNCQCERDLTGQGRTVCRACSRNAENTGFLTFNNLAWY